MNLKDATALITGGGRGIGAATAVALAEQGCKVAIVDKDETLVEEMKAKLSAINPDCTAFAADLLDDAQIEKTVADFMEKYGRIDILINGAGVCKPHNFAEVTIEEWDLAFGINVRAVFVMGQKIMKIMEMQKSGHIINFASSAIYYPTPWFHATYGASKHAVEALSQAMQDYGKRCGVKVSTIWPGPVLTPMTQQMEAMDNYGVSGWSDMRAGGRFLKAEDIVEGILFLLNQPKRAMVHDFFIDATFFGE